MREKKWVFMWLCTIGIGLLVSFQAQTVFKDISIGGWLSEMDLQLNIVDMSVLTELQLEMKIEDRAKEKLQSYSYNKKEYYIEPTKKGRLILTLERTTISGEFKICIYDKNRKYMRLSDPILEDGYYKGEVLSVDTLADRYYIRVVDLRARKEKYTLFATLDTTEPNDTITTAVAIETGDTENIFKGIIDSSVDVDWYKFKVYNKCQIEVRIQSSLDTNFEVYGSDGKTEVPHLIMSDGRFSTDLDPGVYYIKNYGDTVITKEYPRSYSFNLTTAPVGSTGWTVRKFYPYPISTPHICQKPSVTSTKLSTTFGYYGLYFKHLEVRPGDLIAFIDSNNKIIASFSGVKKTNFWIAARSESIIIHFANLSGMSYGYDLLYWGFGSWLDKEIYPHEKIVQGSSIPVMSDNSIPVIQQKKTVLRNMPDPFNPETDIAYEVPEHGNVVLSVFNTKGKKVIELVNGAKETGSHSVHWNGKDSRGKDMPSGVYYAVLEVNGTRFTKKMVMLK